MSALTKVEEFDANMADKDSRYQDYLFDSRFAIDEEVIELLVLNVLPKDNSNQNLIDGSIYSVNKVDLDLYNTLIKQPQLVRTLEWRTFEKLIAKILEDLGYAVKLMQGTKDGGIDVIAFNKVTDLGEHKYIIQAKQWKNKVGIEPIRSLAFLQGHERITKACLVTTSTFTKGAWKLAEDYKWQMELKDINGLMDWIKSIVNKKKRQ